MNADMDFGNWEAWYESGIKKSWPGANLMRCADVSSGHMLTQALCEGRLVGVWDHTVEVGYIERQDMAA